MILERSKNAKRNGLWGIISKVVSILFPFAVRTVIIKELGSDYLGLSSLFTSILTVLNITELGFGTAIVYSMYKPLAEDDTELLCAYLNYYKKVYRWIGILIFVSGCCILPFLRYLIHGDVPGDVSIYILYLLYLANAAVSYWLFAYKASILTIYQRNDIKSKIVIILSTIMYLTQILVLITTHNYYLYTTVLLMYTICNNIVPAMYIKRFYPQYVCRGEISKRQKTDIREKASGLMLSKITLVSRNAFDSVVISAFLGLKIVAIYNNYYYIINALTSLLIVLTSSMAAGIGNSIAVDTPQKNLQDLGLINFWYMWIAGWCTVCLTCLFQPFMQIWVGESLMLQDGIMWLFSIYFILTKAGEVQEQYFDASGLWWHRRWYSVAEAGANMLLNLILGYYLGIAGVILATIVTAFFINFLGASRIIFKYYFKDGLKNYLWTQIFYVCVTIMVAFVTSEICSVIFFKDTVTGLWMTIVIRSVICVVVPNVLFFLIYNRTKIFQRAFPWLRRRLWR